MREETGTMGNDGRAPDGNPHALLHMLGVAFLEAAAWAAGMTRDVEDLKEQVARLTQPAPQADSLAAPTKIRPVWWYDSADTDYLGLHLRIGQRVGHGDTWWFWEGFTADIEKLDEGPGPYATPEEAKLAAEHWSDTYITPHTDEPPPTAPPPAAAPPGWKRRKPLPKVDVVSGAQFLADVKSGAYATPYPVGAIVARREQKPGLEDMRYRVAEYADADMVYLEDVTNGKRALVGVDFLTSAFEVVSA